MGLFDFFKSKGVEYSAADKAKLDGIDPLKFVTVEQFEQLKAQIEELAKIDTVKFIENSNPKSSIRKISLSIDDKGTFKAFENPANNISHTI